MLQILPIGYSKSKIQELFDITLQIKLNILQTYLSLTYDMTCLTAMITSSKHSQHHDIFNAL